MSRRKQSTLDDLVLIASKLPWKVGVVLAVVAYLALHYVASLPPVPIGVAGTKEFGQTVGPSAGRQVMVTFAFFLQFIVPFAFVIGAGLSYSKQRRQGEIHSEVASAPSKNALEKMTWREFEGLTAETFRRQGYRVVERGGDGPDGGVDLELYMGNDKYLVQCKQWKVTKVGVAAVRELYGVIAAERAVGGFVVASGEFTDDANSFAEGRSIKLVPTQSFLRMIGAIRTEPSFGTAPPAPSEPICPKCGSPMVERTAKQGALAGSTFWGCSRFPDCRGMRKTATD